MPEILFPGHNLSAKELLGSERVGNLAHYNALGCSAFTANKPYCLEEHPEGRFITGTFARLPPASRERLLCTVDTFGDLTSVLAGFYDKHLAGLTLQDGAGLAGAGATVADARLSGLQKALLELRKLKGIGHATNVERAKRILAVRKKFKVLQMRYRAEMNNLVNHADIGKNRGGPAHQRRTGCHPGDAWAQAPPFVIRGGNQRRKERRSAHPRGTGVTLAVTGCLKTPCGDP
ncbi:MAG: hypothetical protein WDA11_11810 [Thiohalomonadaceae bacterium]